jgi:hypothetical protein
VRAPRLNLPADWLYNAGMLFQTVQIVYWLALSTWFGGVLFVAMSAPVIFRIIRENQPILPTVLSVNLENQHGTLLAGSIVAELLSMLLRVEMVCAIALFLSILAQWFMLNGQLPESLARTGLFLAAAGMVFYDWRFVGPRIRKSRAEYIDHADEPEVANPAKEQFDRYHRESVTVLSIVLFLLLGMILFSADIQHLSVIFTPVK